MIGSPVILLVVTESAMVVVLRVMKMRMKVTGYLIKLCIIANIRLDGARREGQEKRREGEDRRRKGEERKGEEKERTGEEKERTGEERMGIRGEDKREG